MVDLLIRNVPEALKKKLAELAERSGLSLSEQAKEILRRGMVTEESAMHGVSTWDAFRSTLAVDDGDEFARIMDEIETERKNDFGRTLETFE